MNLRLRGELRKAADEFPVQAWPWTERDDAFLVDRIVAGDPLESLEAWIRRSAAVKKAKREGHRPPGATALRDRLFRYLVRKFVEQGWKRGDVIQELAHVCKVDVSTVRRACPKNVQKGPL